MKDKNKVIKKILNSLNANDVDYARRLIENDLKRLGAKDEYYFYSALIAKDLEIKKELYTNAIEANPNFTDAYINRGLVYNELKEYKNYPLITNSILYFLDMKCLMLIHTYLFQKLFLQEI